MNFYARLLGLMFHGRRHNTLCPNTWQSLLPETLWEEDLAARMMPKCADALRGLGLSLGSWELAVY